jgi:hypothetical protein
MGQPRELPREPDHVCLAKHGMSGPRCTAALATTAPTNAVSCCARLCMPVEVKPSSPIKQVTTPVRKIESLSAFQTNRLPR